MKTRNFETKLTNTKKPKTKKPRRLKPVYFKVRGSPAPLNDCAKRSGPGVETEPNLFGGGDPFCGVGVFV